MEIQAIKKYMKENHITYEDLAKKSNLSISTIKKIFSGISQYPRIDTIQSIEKALGLYTSGREEKEKTPVFQRKTEIQAYFDELTPYEQGEVIGFIKRMLYNKGVDTQRIKEKYCS